MRWSRADTKSTRASSAGSPRSGPRSSLPGSARHARDPSEGPIAASPDGTIVAVGANHGVAKLDTTERWALDRSAFEELEPVPMLVTWAALCPVGEADVLLSGGVIEAYLLVR